MPTISKNELKNNPHRTFTSHAKAQTFAILLFGPPCINSEN